MARKVFGVFPEVFHGFQNRKLFSEVLLNGLSISEIVTGFICVIILESIHHYEGDGQIYELITAKSLVFRWSVYITAFFLIMCLGVFSNRHFIYFQF